MRPTIEELWRTVVDASPTVHATIIALFAVLASTLAAGRVARRGAADALMLVKDQQRYDSEQRRHALVEDRIRRARDTALAREQRLEDLAEARAQRLLDLRVEAARDFSAAVCELDDFVTTHDVWAAARTPASIVAACRELASRSRQLAPRAAPIRLLFGRDSDPATYAERCIADVELVTGAFRSRLFALRRVLDAATAGSATTELDGFWRSATTENARVDTALAELGRDHDAFDEAALAFFEAPRRRDVELEPDAPPWPGHAIRTPA